MDEMTLTLSSPITEEQFDAITDVDFDNTDRIWFHTKNGKDVEFVKRKKGKWIEDVAYYDEEGCPCIVTRCNQCGAVHPVSNFCHECGADMRGDDHDQDK